MESVKLPSMDNTPDIFLYRTHSVLLFPFPCFSLFFHVLYHCFGSAPTQKLFHWPADCTNSFTAFLSESRASSSPLCSHYTLPCKTLWYPSWRPPQNILALVLLHSCSVFYHNPTDCSLNSCSGHISLSVLCKHCAHIQVSTWSAPFCVYISRG